MRTQTTKVWKNVAAALLTLAIALGAMLLAPAVAQEVAGDKSIACVSASGITVPGGGWTKNAGSYVYYGKYDGTNPTKYRVLANGTSDFGGTTMLLDCDEVLTLMPYDNTDPKSNAWSGSDLQAWIQGTNFLTKQNNFSSQEATAITQSAKAEGTTADQVTDYALSSEQAFVLSVTEAQSYYADDDARKKIYESNNVSEYDVWWLRSAITHYIYGIPCAAVVSDNGVVLKFANDSAYRVDTANAGVSPAFTIDLSSVIFSSVVKEAVDGASGPEYKLTIKDDGLTAEPGDATIFGTTVTVPYAIRGASVNQSTRASYVVLRNAWGSKENEVLAYGKLGLASEKDGTFVLPGGCAANGWGEEYFVYVLAENVNGEKETDYASVPSGVKLIKPEPTTYMVTAKADPEAGGTAEASADKAAEGAKVELSAKPSEGYDFVNWTVDDKGALLEGANSAKTTLTMGTADVTATAHFKKKEEPKPADPIVPTGTGHLQKLGDTPARESDKGIVIGTTGESRRLEAIAVSLPTDVDGAIRYRGHLQGRGWGEWADGGKACGTTGEARRLEAVQMELTGAVADGYSVWYRVHSQTFGWLGWAKDGQAAGTSGQAKRAEAVEVQVLPQGQAPEGYVEHQASYVGAVSADVHLQKMGWTGAASALEFGTTGQSRRLEAIRLSVPNQPEAGGVSYEVHAQKKGWMPAAADGALAGTTGQARRLEAVRISLTGDMAKEGNYSVWYRVHSQTYGWLGWAHDGEPAGTTGLAKRAEAIDVQILPQGQVPRGYDASKAACVNG